jgi:hypothetical protein
MPEPANPLDALDALATRALREAEALQETSGRQRRALRSKRFRDRQANLRELETLTLAGRAWCERMAPGLGDVAAPVLDRVAAVTLGLLEWGPGNPQDGTDEIAERRLYDDLALSYRFPVEDLMGLRRQCLEVERRLASRPPNVRRKAQRHRARRPPATLNR